MPTKLQVLKERIHDYEITMLFHEHLRELVDVVDAAKYVIKEFDRFRVNLGDVASVKTAIYDMEQKVVKLDEEV